MSTPNDRLRITRERAGYKLPSEAAAAMGISRWTYNQHENATKGPGIPRNAAVRYAQFFRISLDWLLMGKGSPKPVRSEALLIGKVGAGAEIVRLEHPDVLEGVAIPEGLGAPNAAEIAGDSQYPLQPGWLIFYGPENEGVPDTVLGKMCVVQIKDGPTLLKIPKRGTRKGLFRLESWNAPPREDEKLSWAALVKDIRPR